MERSNMAQPETAAGREELPSPAEETFAKMADRLINEEAEPVEDDEEEEAEPEGHVEGEDLEIDPEEGEEKPEGIAPPVSLNAEEKEVFKGLPEEAKAFTARRINELERAFQAKAQEAASVRESTHLEYLRWAQALQQDAAVKLNQFAEALKPKAPDARLARTDPAAYAHMLSEYHERSAQREQAQREAELANQQWAAYQNQITQQEAQTSRLRLQAELPELFDPATGQERVKSLLATAHALGIDPSAITNVDMVKALQVTAEWRTKAEKFDRATSRRNERAAKKPTPTAKPGPPQGTRTKGRRVDAAWKLVKESRAGADRDAAAAIWLEEAGL